MANEYKLSYTAAQIDEKLGKDYALQSDFNSLQNTVDKLGQELDVSVKVVTQALTPTEKAQARENIGVVQPDYSQNDSYASDYIKNRTHWVEEFIGAETIFEESALEFSDYTGMILLPLNFIVNDEYIFTIDGVEYICVCKEFIDGDTWYVLGNMAFMGIPDAEDTGEPFCMAYMLSAEMGVIMIPTGPEATTYDIKIAHSCLIQEFHKLNNNYLNIDTAPTSGSNNPITSDGVYNALQNVGNGLPEVNTSNNGAFLRVVNGAWTTVALPSAEDGEF